MKDTAQTALTLAKRTQARAIFLVLLAGSLWGCIGLFSRTLSALGVGPESIVILRNAGACVVLAVLFLIYDRSIFRIQLRHFPIFLGTGIVSILFFTLCYFNSQQVSSLAVSAILLYTAPTFVVLLSALFWREKITKQKLLALIIAFFGCCCVAGLLGGSLAVTPKGLLLGIGSGLFYSSYTLFGRVALSHYPPFTVTFYTFLVAGIGSLFLIRPQELAIVTGSGRGFLLAQHGPALSLLHQGSQRPGRRRQGVDPGLRRAGGGIPGGHPGLRGAHGHRHAGGPGVYPGLDLYSEVKIHGQA